MGGTLGFERSYAEDLWKQGSKEENGIGTRLFYNS
jgi:hypothetical protein